MSTALTRLYFTISLELRAQDAKIIRFFLKRPFSWEVGGGD